MKKLLIVCLILWSQASMALSLGVVGFYIDAYNWIASQEEVDAAARDRVNKCMKEQRCMEVELEGRLAIVNIGDYNKWRRANKKLRDEENQKIVDSIREKEMADYNTTRDSRLDWGNK